MQQRIAEKPKDGLAKVSEGWQRVFPISYKVQCVPGYTFPVKTTPGW